MLNPRARVLLITEHLLKTCNCHKAFDLLISRSFREIPQVIPPVSVKFTLRPQWYCVFPSCYKVKLAPTS